MRTFDEAFEIVSSRPQFKIEEDLANGSPDIDNEEFKQTIRGIVRILVESLKEIPEDDPTRTYATMCACIHEAFQLGKLIGIEMERSGDLESSCR